MIYKNIKYQKIDMVGIITLNRPEHKNAINLSMVEELAEVCREIMQDKQVRVVTVTGAGQYFSAGADASAACSCRAGSVAESIARLEYPVIAAINGDAIGQGLELALACDIRIAADSAQLAMPEVREGFIPWDGGTQRLPRLIGKTRALEMILLSQTISTEEACQFGLVNKIVPASELASVAASLAHQIAEKAPIALRYAKEAINKGLDLTLEQALRLEADLYLLLHTTNDRTMGIRAIVTALIVGVARTRSSTRLATAA